MQQRSGLLCPYVTSTVRAVSINRHRRRARLVSREGKLEVYSNIDRAHALPAVLNEMRHFRRFDENSH